MDINIYTNVSHIRKLLTYFRFTWDTIADEKKNLHYGNVNVD